MQAIEAVSMIVVFVVLAVIPYDVQAQTSGPCKPECSTGKIPISIKTAADAAYKTSSYSSQISGLESQNNLLTSRTAGCPCNSCTARKEILYTCGRCYIYWPFNGLINVNCAALNDACKLSCGCKGTCQMHGSALRWVILYCPHQTPPWPIIKQVRVCTNCCCQA